MSLRFKLLLLTALGVVALVLSIHLVSRTVLLEQFEHLEQTEAQDDLSRAKKIFETEIHGLQQKVADYAAWDDTYAFVQKPTDAYIRSDFDDATFEILGLNFALIYDSSGKLIFSKGYDFDRKQPVALSPAFFKELEANYGAVIHLKGRSDGVTGLVPLPGCPAILASMPILSSNREGPVVGTIVFGRYLDASAIKRISNVACRPVDIRLRNDPHLPDDFRRMELQVIREGFAFVPDSETVALGYALQKDIFGKNDFIIKVELNRNVYQHGRSVLNRLIVLLAGLGILFGVIGAGLVERTLLSRLTQLSNEVSQIGSSGNLASRVSKGPDDELSHVASAINRMLNDLGNAEIRYRAIIESQSELIARYRLDGTITYANSAYARLWERSPDALIGKRIQDLIPHEDEKKRFRAHLARIPSIRPEDTSLTHELPARDKEGVVHWFVWTDRIIFDDQGNAIEVQTTGRDITKRKRAEDALQESEKRFRAIVQDQTEMICRYLPDSTLTFVNEAYCKLKGMSKEELIGRKIADLTVDPEKHRLFEAHLAELCALTPESPILPGESNDIGPDGRRDWREWVDRAIFDESGKMVEIQAVGRDVTELKLAQEELVRLSSAIENAAEVVIVTDLDANIQYVNPAFEKVSGYSRAEVMGKNPRILKSGKLGTEYYQNMWETLIRGEIWTGEFINKKKDGTLFHEKGSIAPIRTPAGKVLGYVAVKRDVSREIQMEAELRQAQKMEAIGQLAGGIAHDFNNILASIMGYAKLAADDTPVGTEMRDDLDQILKAGKRGKELVEQMLAFSRQSGIKGAKKSHQIGEIVKDSMKLIRPSLPSNIVIDLKISPDLPFVVIDPIEIHQVIINLCLNASQAMPSGGRLLVELQSVSISSEEALRLKDAVTGKKELIPGQYVTLSVEDTGSGIPKEILPRIFEPFFTTRKKGQGTGMGLAVVYGIVKSHHGVIHIYTEIDKGATFRIYLPTSKTAEHFSPEKESKDFKGGTESILVVDDEEPLARMIGKTLTRLGYRVTVKSKSTEALEIVAQAPDSFDLVVSDQTMPGMTGDQLAQEIRKIRPNMPIILCSGFSEILTPEREQEVKVNKLVRKPFVGDELEIEIRQILDEKAKL